MASIEVTSIACGAECPTDLAIDAKLCVGEIPPEEPSSSCPNIQINCSDLARTSLPLVLNFSSGGRIYIYRNGKGTTNLPIYMSRTNVHPFPLIGEQTKEQTTTFIPFDPDPDEEGCEITITYVYVPDAVARIIDYSRFVLNTIGSFAVNTIRFLISLPVSFILSVFRLIRPRRQQSDDQELR